MHDTLTKKDRTKLTMTFLKDGLCMLYNDIQKIDVFSVYLEPRECVWCL